EEPLYFAAMIILPNIHRPPNRCVHRGCLELSRIRVQVIKVPVWTGRNRRQTRPGLLRGKRSTLSIWDLVCCVDDEHTAILWPRTDRTWRLGHDHRFRN